MRRWSRWQPIRCLQLRRINVCRSETGESDKSFGAVPDGFPLGLEFGPAFEGSQLLAGCAVVEARFGFFEKEGKVGFRNTVVSAEGALGLVSRSSRFR
jgi:hypothetical protein